MSTELHDQLTNLSATPLVEEPTLTTGVVSSTPLNNIQSSTFLQEQVYTGMQFTVKLPFGAVNGFQPMFAIRVSPIVMTPHIYNFGDNLADCLDKIATNRNLTELLPRNASRESIMGFEGQNFRVYNGTTMRFTGPEPPQSAITRCFRFNRVDIVYTIRLVSTYTGGGILMVVPVKGVLRGTSPFTIAGTPQITANANQVNSNLQLDLSRSRQFRFVYPYEYPTEYQDFNEDLYRWPSYNANTSENFSKLEQVGIAQYDNWFVVGTRGSIISPSNAETLTFYVDYAFGQHDLNTPMFPTWRALQPVVPILSDGTNTAFFEYSQGQFRDSGQAVATETTLVNRTGATIFGQFTTNRTSGTAYSVANGASITVKNGQSYFMGYSADTIFPSQTSDRLIGFNAVDNKFRITAGGNVFVVPKKGEGNDIVFVSAGLGQLVVTLTS